MLQEIEEVVHIKNLILRATENPCPKSFMMLGGGVCDAAGEQKAQIEKGKKQRLLMSTYLLLTFFYSLHKIGAS